LRQGIAGSNPEHKNLISKKRALGELRKDQRAEAVGKLEEMVKWLKKL